MPPKSPKSPKTPRGQHKSSVPQTIPEYSARRDDYDDDDDDDFYNSPPETGTRAPPPSREPSVLPTGGSNFWQESVRRPGELLGASAAVSPDQDLIEFGTDDADLLDLFSNSSVPPSTIPPAVPVASSAAASTSDVDPFAAPNIAPQSVIADPSRIVVVSGGRIGQPVAPPSRSMRRAVTLDDLVKVSKLLNLRRHVEAGTPGAKEKLESLLGPRTGEVRADIPAITTYSFAADIVEHSYVDDYEDTSILGNIDSIISTHPIHRIGNDAVKPAALDDYIDRLQIIIRSYFSPEQQPFAVVVLFLYLANGPLNSIIRHLERRLQTDDELPSAATAAAAAAASSAEPSQVEDPTQEAESHLMAVRGAVITKSRIRQIRESVLYMIMSVCIGSKVPDEVAHLIRNIKSLTLDSPDILYRLLLKYTPRDRLKERLHRLSAGLTILRARLLQEVQNYFTYTNILQSVFRIPAHIASGIINSLLQNGPYIGSAIGSGIGAGIAFIFTTRDRLNTLISSTSGAFNRLLSRSLSTLTGLLNDVDTRVESIREASASATAQAESAREELNEVRDTFRSVLGEFYKKYISSAPTSAAATAEPMVDETAGPIGAAEPTVVASPETDYNQGIRDALLSERVEEKSQPEKRERESEDSTDEGNQDLPQPSDFEKSPENNTQQTESENVGQGQGQTDSTDSDMDDSAESRKTRKNKSYWVSKRSRKSKSKYPPRKNNKSKNIKSKRNKSKTRKH
jgi:hypothetical protein